jgi:hypothetical protein
VLLKELFEPQAARLFAELRRFGANFDRLGENSDHAYQSSGPAQSRQWDSPRGFESHPFRLPMKIARSSAKIKVKLKVSGLRRAGFGRAIYFQAPG